MAAVIRLTALGRLSAGITSGGSSSGAPLASPARTQMLSCSLPACCYSPASCCTLSQSAPIPAALPIRPISEPAMTGVSHHTALQSP